MPHIRVDGCDTSRQIKMINISVEIQFSREAYINRPKANLRIDELKQKLENLLMEYFDVNSISSDVYTNHEWNTRNSF